MSLIEPVEGMPKKRRKLNKEMEAEMAAAKRKIELVGALINDIRDEDIQGEYLGAHLSCHGLGPAHAGNQAEAEKSSRGEESMHGVSCCLLYTSPSPRDS